MKIAVLADIHGNGPAFEAVLADIDRQQPAVIVCGGDVVDPFPEAPHIWQTLEARGIPIILGNHEEYVRTYFTADDGGEMRDDIRFQPLQATGRRFRPDVVEKITALPLTITLPGPKGADVLICHASPASARRPFWKLHPDYTLGLNPKITATFDQHPEQVIVGSHIHLRDKQRWRDKWLVLTGSVGLPLSRQPEAQYLLLTHHRGGWQIDHRSVPYDVAGYARRLAKDGFLAEAGPIGWLFFDELLTADFRLVPFFWEFCPTEKPTTLEGWRALVQCYFESIGRWEVLSAYL